MATDVRTSPLGEPRGEGRISIQTIARLSFLPLLAGVAILLRWQRLWLYLAAMAATLAVNLLVMRARNPAVVRRRLARARPESAFDRVVMVGGIVLGIAVFGVASFEALVLATKPLPWSWAVVGLILHVLGDVPAVWAISENPFARREIHLQPEHQVITTGPYRWVRHPMYVGMIVMLAGWPLVLGSLWAFVPTAAIAAMMIARTAFEDRMLRRDLPGYEEYAQRTRFRLLPGVW